MFKQITFRVLLLISALLLVVKPLIGFTLYHQAKAQGENEFITVIKAFSKRKQEYLDWVETSEGSIICNGMSAVVGRIRTLLIFHFSNFFSPSVGKNPKNNFLSQLFSPFERLYLLYLRLTL
ncbi:hypothetical protein [Sphingobacterium sp.]|uniref:hypothetical protein n=1 Tax=Sphingobacterium sp. TaxID=341027 RepID=UPI0028A9A937|nr:hypothetical protein [Sphingobacterium sp.]